MTSGLFDDLAEQVVPEREGGGRPRLRTAERGQVALRAVSLDDLVAADHRVRLVWRFAEGLDLTPLYAQIKAVEGRPGHPPVDPRILVALWLFATLEGIGSARHLARLCKQHIAFQWLCGGVDMNHKTLSDFRVEHGPVLEGLLVDSFAALMAAGVAGLDRVAQDGVRVRASAGAASFRRHSTLRECHRRAKAEVERLRRELDDDPGVASRREASARRRGPRTPGRRGPGGDRGVAGRTGGEGMQTGGAPVREGPAGQWQDTGGGDRGEGAAGLDPRPAGPCHEDGRRWFPAGLQRAVRR
jgi:transposase